MPYGLWHVKLIFIFNGYINIEEQYPFWANCLADRKNSCIPL